MTKSTTAPEITPPRPRGRPRLAIGEGRQTPITWRTTAERRIKALRLATAAGLTLSAWLDKRIDVARE